MKKPLPKNVLKFVGYLLIFSLIVFLFKVFLPGTYNVQQLQKREGTKYWDLTTGSKIGYTLISAKGEKKPYPIIYLHGGPGGPIIEQPELYLKTIKKFLNK